MAIFGIKTKADKAREARDRVRQEIYRIEGSSDYQNPYTDYHTFIRADSHALEELTAYLQSNNLLRTNYDYTLPKQELIEHCGEERVYNFEPVSLECRLDSDRVLVRCDGMEYTFIGTLPPDRAKSIQGAKLVQALFCGTKYKELSTEDFEHYNLETGEHSGIRITYRIDNPSYIVKLARLEELKRQLAQM